MDGIHGTVGPEYDHLVLRIDLGEPWLVDVGWGDTFREPMPLLADSEFVDSLGRPYRLSVRGDEWDVIEWFDPASAPQGSEAYASYPEWRTQYRFTLGPRTFAEFEPACLWQQTEAPSFTEHRICTIATPDGRRTLMDDRLIERSGTTRSERMVTEDEVPTLLRDLFGVELG